MTYDSQKSEVNVIRKAIEHYPFIFTHILITRGFSMQDTITIDPKDFIQSPYWKCPKCNTNDSFGVLMINNKSYTRRCKSCWYTASFKLPVLKKKVIYLDQMAISNIMKVLNPYTKAYEKMKSDSFWIALFEKLDTLCKLQIIICPETFHSNESMLSPFYEPLQRMYELLSSGITFYDNQTIKRFQLFHHFKNWLKGKDNPKFDFDPNLITRDNIHRWQERLVISVNMPQDEEWIESLRTAREKTAESFVELAKQWSEEADKDFNYFFNNEYTAFGKIHLQIYAEHYKKVLNFLINLPELSGLINPDDYAPPPAVITIVQLKGILKREGYSDEDATKKVMEYLASTSLKNIPFLKISSMMYAALARKFAHGGRKKPPNQGMANDIEMISVLMPYCTAMFIDNECHSYLKEVPLRDKLCYGTRIFSQSNKEEFLSYLDEIKSEVSNEHYKKVEEVYGSNWTKPYIEVFLNDE
jgi:transcription elongation factor Elf1